jgi:hypothetical protein
VTIFSSLAFGRQLARGQAICHVMTGRTSVEGLEARVDVKAGLRWLDEQPGSRAPGPALRAALSVIAKLHRWSATGLNTSL